MLRKLLLLVMCLLVITPGAAQEEAEPPLLALLARVPDMPQVRQSLVTYADYRVMEARRGIDGPPTAQDFADRTETAALWFAASSGLSAGMQMNFLLAYLEDMPRLVGFAFFDVDRTLVFGSPPGQGLILQGDFDPARIAAAYAARDFTQQAMGDVTLWCGPDGCDSGLDANLAEREVGNPFGGELGRREPLALLGDDLLANSAEIGVVEAIISAHNGQQRSLADSPEIRAVAEAVLSAGAVAQIILVPPLDVMSIPLELTALLGFAEGVDMDEIATLEGFDRPLPQYSLVALADVTLADEQAAVIALAYPGAESARAAGEVLAARLANFQSLRTRQPFTDYLDEVGAVIGEPIIHESASASRTVLLLPLRYPLPDNQPRDEMPRYLGSSLVFRALVSELYGRGLYILATEAF